MISNYDNGLFTSKIVKRNERKPKLYKGAYSATNKQVDSVIVQFLWSKIYQTGKHGSFFADSSDINELAEAANMQEIDNSSCAFFIRRSDTYE